MINVYLGDLTHETVTLSIDNMPLNVAFLSTYLQQEIEGVFKVKLFKSPQMLLEAIKQGYEQILFLFKTLD
jgi:hypothetical protein